MAPNMLRFFNWLPLQLVVKVCRRSFVWNSAETPIFSIGSRQELSERKAEFQTEVLCLYIPSRYPYFIHLQWINTAFNDSFEFGCFGEWPVWFTFEITFNLDLNLEISDTICSSLNLKLSSRFQDLQRIMNIQLIGRKPWVWTWSRPGFSAKIDSNKFKNIF